MYAKNTRPSERFKQIGAQSATIESRTLGVIKFTSDGNVPAKRIDFFNTFAMHQIISGNFAN